jgi:hypothetical protein
MYSNKKLVALLGGREYKDSSTLRKFLTPSIRKQLKDANVDFIIATNNNKAARQFRQIDGMQVVELTPELHQEFMSRQREEKPNLGAETREIINQYAIENKYEYVLYLDDNIERMYCNQNGKRIYFSQKQPQAFFHIMMLLFFIAENSNFGAVGLEMAAFAPSKNEEVNLTSGFAYSFFVQKVDEHFKFENATEEDILMNIYNGYQNKPSVLIRNLFSYSKSGKKSKGGGNRKLYNDLLKENKRGIYTHNKYPHIYTMKVSYNVKSSTNQKEQFLQHKHTLRKPKEWDAAMVYEKEKVFQEIARVQNLIYTDFL